MKIARALLVLAIVSVSTIRAQQRLTWEDITGPTGYTTVLNGSGDSLFATNSRGVIYCSSDQGIHWSGILGYPSHSPILDMTANGSNVAVWINDVDVIRGRFKVLRWNLQPNSWSLVTVENAAYLSNILIDSKGEVYEIEFSALTGYYNGRAVTYNQGLPFPTFNGQFAPVHNKAAFGDDGIIYVGVDTTGTTGVGGLYTSADTGRSWTQYLGNYHVTSFAGSLQSTMAVGTREGVLESTDGGQSWHGLGLEGHLISSLLVGGGGRLFALVDGLVYRYDPSIAGWSILTANTQSLTSLVETADGAFLASSEAAGAFRSIDGNLWGGGELRGKDVFALASNDSGEIVAGTLGSGIYRSLFGGSAWVKAELDSSCSEVYSLLRTPGVLYAGTMGGVTVSTDQGLTWQLAGQSAFQGGVFSLGRIADGTVLAGTNEGIFRSSDGGVSWTSSGLASSQVLFIDVSPSNLALASTATDGIFVSTDGGSTWTKGSLAREDVQTVLAPPSGCLLVAVYGGVYRSVDNGSSWTYRQFDKSYVYSLAAGDSGMIYAGSATSVFSSADDGITWQAAGDSGIAQKTILALSHTDSGKLLAGTYRGGVYRTLESPTFAFPDGVRPDEKRPTSFVLAQNFPNPFNPSTEIVYALAKQSDVRLRIFNILGQQIATLVNERQYQGTYHVTWSANNLPSGVYFYRLDAGPTRITRKMLYLR